MSCPFTVAATPGGATNGTFGATGAAGGGAIPGGGGGGGNWALVAGVCVEACLAGSAFETEAVTARSVATAMVNGDTLYVKTVLSPFVSALESARTSYTIW